MLGNFIMMYGLVLAYQFTPLDIEWVGLLVIDLYLIIYIMPFRQHQALASQPA